MTIPTLSTLLLLGALMPSQAASPNLHFYVDATSFTAEGTWVPVDPKDHAANQSESRLDCDKATGQCIEATAEDYAGHPHIDVSYLQIAKWDHNGIVASDSNAICVTRTINIGFAAKHVSDVREMKVLPAEKRKACEQLAIPASASWTFLLKNSERWNEERNSK
jgi:hypothetical protein